MVLVTVYETIGSTYSKPGRRMLISARGEYQGLISGGCLEADLIERAKRVLDAGVSAPVTYDLRDEAEDVYGLGVGCNGLIRVLLQPLLPVAEYAPMPQLCSKFTGRDTVEILTVISHQDHSVPSGATWCRGQDGNIKRLDRDDVTGSDIENQFGVAIAKNSGSVASRLYCDDVGNQTLIAPLMPIPRLLILGAGLDAVPLLRIAAELGWTIGICDHRSAYLNRGDLDAADYSYLVDPRALYRDVDLSEYDAAVVMSHHLDTDEMYLRALIDAPLKYLGVLGPPARRHKLLQRINGADPSLGSRLRGPLGLDIGGGSPEAIALSIVAELHSIFSRGQ